VELVDRYVPNEEVGLYFASADLVVLPYTSATGSGVVQVAFGYGVPVLTTTVGSLPEVVTEGETGYLVPPGSPAALADAIARFFSSSGEVDLRAGIERLTREQGWEKTVEVIESIACPDHGRGTGASSPPNRTGEC
jgi:glycosyltransferase involved in cell wall biosynthesis